ncbi:unnamed protein product [Symbiodinium natans]|uniref:Uncharacterized protein n=1 Tax=Symbiodinium natans TaxID=878477 RepID=A0A812N5J8_9DINO|nr:unnamed protein product [Symbiodinium natans]
MCLLGVLFPFLRPIYPALPWLVGSGVSASDVEAALGAAGPATEQLPTTSVYRQPSPAQMCLRRSVRWAKAVALSPKRPSWSRLEAIGTLQRLATPPRSVPQAEDALYSLLLATTEQKEGELQGSAEEALRACWEDSGDAKVNTEMARGIELLDDQKADEAVEAFTRVTEMAPNFAEGWHKRSIGHYAKQDHPSVLGFPWPLIGARTAVVQESVAELLKDLQLLQAKLVAAYNLERATAVTVPSRDPARSDTGQRSITSVSEGLNGQDSVSSVVFSRSQASRSQENSTFPQIDPNEDQATSPVQPKLVSLAERMPSKLKQTPSGSVTCSERARVTTAASMTDPKQRCILQPTSWYRLCWDTLALLTLMQDMVLTPLQAFDEQPQAQILRRAFTDAFWLVDIGMSFCTAVHVDGVLTQDRFGIARAYAKSWLPFDLMVLAAELKKILDTVPVAMAMSRSWQHAIDVGKYLAVATYMGHLLVCLWYFVGSAPDGWVADDGLGSSDLATKYSTSMQVALSRLPASAMRWNMELQTDAEHGLAICATFMALGLSSAFVSKMTNVMAAWQKSRQRRKQVLQSAREYCGRAPGRLLLRAEHAEIR